MSSANFYVPSSAPSSPVIAECIEAALKIVRSDTALRPPKTEQERRNGFAEWLAEKQVEYRPAVEQTIAHKLLVEPTSEIVRKVYEQQVRAEIETLLRTFALHYHAGLWVRRQMGDAVVLQLPEPYGTRWLVPLGVLKYRENLGRVILDAEGNVITDESTTRQQLLERLHDPSLSPSETAIRK